MSELWIIRRGDCSTSNVGSFEHVDYFCCYGSDDDNNVFHDSIEHARKYCNLEKAREDMGRLRIESLHISDLYFEVIKIAEKIIFPLQKLLLDGN